jgi:hypothetical protein
VSLDFPATVNRQRCDDDLRCQDCGLEAPSPKVDYDEGLDAFLCFPCIRDREDQPADADAHELLINMEAAMQLAKQPIAYAVEPIAARGFLTVLAGRHSSYKSWLMLMAGHAAHRGESEFAGLHCEATTVLYVDAENGPRLMGRRFAAAGMPSDGLLVADGTKLRLPGDFASLRTLIEATDVGLVVLDSLRRLAPGIRENESDDMAALISDVAKIARDFDVAVVLIHHRSTKKGAATLRGSSSIEDQADLVFTLEHIAGDPDRERRRLKAAKFRIDAEPSPIWLRMGMADGCFTVRAADHHEEDGLDDSEGQGADEQLAGRIDGLADEVRTDGGWAPSRLAAAVGSDQRNGTFQRALRILLDRGAWESEGKTRNRRLRPSDGSHHRADLYGDGANGANGAACGDEEER